MAACDRIDGMDGVACRHRAYAYWSFRTSGELWLHSTSMEVVLEVLRSRWFICGGAVSDDPRGVVLQRWCVWSMAHEARCCGGEWVCGPICTDGCEGGATVT